MSHDIKYKPTRTQPGLSKNCTVTAARTAAAAARVVAAAAAQLIIVAGVYNAVAAAAVVDVASDSVAYLKSWSASAARGINLPLVSSPEFLF